MQPTKPPGGNFTYYGPEGTDVLPLDVTRNVNEKSVASAWTPSHEELAQLNAGGSVRLTVWMMPPPPVMIDVCGPANNKGEEAVWHGNEIGYTWPEGPEGVGDDEPLGLGMDPAGEKPPPPDVGGGDPATAHRADDSPTEA